LTESAPETAETLTSPALRGARYLRLVVAGGVAALAVLMAIASSLDYAFVKRRVDPFTVDRDADLSPAEFDAIVVRLRLLALLLGLVVVLLIRFGRRSDRLAAAIVSSWWTSARRSPRALEGWARTEGPVHVLVLATSIVVGAALRIAFLDVPMRYDEAATFNAFVAQPLYVSLANYSEPNNHLLHTLLVSLAVDALGDGEWAIRLPALIAGIATLPLSYVLARRLYNSTAALLTAALVASSSTLVEYSTNARGYSLLVALTIASLLAAARVIETGSQGAWATLALCSILGFYAIPTMAYAFGGVVGWIAGSQLLRGGSWRNVLVPLGWCVIAVAVGTALLYAPVIGASGIDAVASNRFVEPIGVGEFTRGLPDHVWSTIASWGRDIPVVLSVAFAAATITSLVLTPRLSRFSVPPLVALVAWAALMIAAQRVLPFTRVWLYLVPVVLATGAGFIGWVLEQSRRGVRIGQVTAAAVAVTASILVLDAGSVRASTETGSLPDARAIASYLDATLRPGDTVQAIGSDAILSYYLARRGRDDTPSLFFRRPGRRVFVVVNRTTGDQTLSSALAELPAGITYGAPVHIRNWPSARLYVVRTG
jgi:dolichyl-phosphate-mannose-protein mannosyltransferase